MVPYDYNREGFPDDPAWMGEWDYWQIDGRGCEFPVLPGSEDDPRLIRGELDLRGVPRVFPPAPATAAPRAPGLRRRFLADRAEQGIVPGEGRFDRLIQLIWLSQISAPHCRHR
jgi:hypothetical protein